MKRKVQSIIEERDYIAGQRRKKDRAWEAKKNRVMYAKPPKSFDAKAVYSALRKRGLRTYSWGHGVAVFNNNHVPKAFVQIKPRARSLSTDQQTEMMLLISLGLPCYVYTEKWGIRRVTDSRWPLKVYDLLEEIFGNKIFKKSLKIERAQRGVLSRDEYEADKLERKYYKERNEE